MTIGALAPRSIVRTLAGGAATIFLLSFLSACSADLTQDDLVEAYLASQPDASAEVAGCVVSELVDVYELAGVERELDAVASSPAFAEAQYRAQFHCGQTADVRDQLTEMLIDRDLQPEVAGCVATELVAGLDDSDLDVLMTGELTDQFFDKYFSATYDCDALPG